MSSTPQPESGVEPSEMSPAPGARLVALFDGDCALCTRTMHFIWDRDLEGAVECVDLRDEATARRFHAFSVDAVRAQLHAIDDAGQVFVGIDAVRECGRRLPRYRRVAWILGIPGIRFLAQRVYMIIARNRMVLNPWLRRDECADDACAVDWEALEKPGS
jgi:predicted DCC family thiol-disulfide oxidoreductase YuxK